MAERSVALVDCGRWLSGGTPATDEPRFWGGPIPWITASSLKSKSLTSSGRTLTPEGARAGSRIVPAGTLIFVVRGMSLKKEFRVGIAGTDVAFGQDCKALMPRPGLLSEYLYYALTQSSDNVLRCVDESSHGTGRLETKALGNVRIRIPPPAEQRRIAEILDTVDETIRATELLIAKLEQMKQGLMHDLLTRGVDDGRFLRDPASEPGRFVESALGLLPAGWSVAPLGELAVIAGGVTLGRDTSGPGTVALPYLRVANVQDGFIDTSEMKLVRVYEEEVPRYRLESGDVLMTEGGDFDKLGRGAVWDGRVDPCLHQNHIFRVRCDRSRLLPNFLAVFSGSATGKRYFLRSSKQTTNLASINMTQLKSCPVPTPPLLEQSRIVEVFAREEQASLGEARYLSKLRRLRAGLMDDLLTGRVRVKVEKEHAA